MADNRENELVSTAAALLGAKGGAVRSTSKSIRSKLNAARRWQLRRARYGETGRRAVDKRLASRLEGNPPGQWREKISRPPTSVGMDGSGGGRVDQVSFAAPTSST